MTSSVWVIEARLSFGEGKWKPLTDNVLGRPPVALSRSWARQNAKLMFHGNQYNQAFFKGLTKYPTCRYRVVKYTRI